MCYIQIQLGKNFKIHAVLINMASRALNLVIIFLSFYPASSLLTLDPPHIRRLCAGTSVTFKCKQTGTFPLQADWLLDNTKVSRGLHLYTFESHHFFTITNTTVADSGKYDYEIINIYTGRPRESTLSSSGSSVVLIVENCSENSSNATLSDYSSGISDAPNETRGANLIRNSSDAKTDDFFKSSWDSVAGLAIGIIATVGVAFLLMRFCPDRVIRLCGYIAGSPLSSQLPIDTFAAFDETLKFKLDDVYLYTSATRVQQQVHRPS